MELILYIAIGIIIGVIIGWLLASAKTTSATQAEKDAAQQKYNELEKELVGYKATVTSQLKTATENFEAKANGDSEFEKYNG
jgi:uncharacterized membrane-anchored protein YhcB (DUF1043 family)